MIRYALAVYCSNLTDSSRQVMPVGVLVVDETAKRYAFKYLDSFSDIRRADTIIKAIWNTVPEILESRFEDYLKNNNSRSCKEITDDSFGFISLVISEWRHSNLSFSNSEPLDKEGEIEKLTEMLFRDKVLRALQ